MFGPLLRELRARTAAETMEKSCSCLALWLMFSLEWYHPQWYHWTESSYITRQSRQFSQTWLRVKLIQVFLHLRSPLPGFLHCVKSTVKTNQDSLVLATRKTHVRLWMLGSQIPPLSQGLRCFTASLSPCQNMSSHSAAIAD